MVSRAMRRPRTKFHLFLPDGLRPIRSRYRVVSSRLRIDAANLQSLVWEGDSLIDWAGGGERFHLDGTRRQRVYTSFGSMFDRAVGLADGSFTVIYGRLGTKAVLLKEGKVHR